MGEPEESRRPRRPFSRAEFGRRIAGRRAAVGKTQEEVAAASGMARSHVTLLEGSQRYKSLGFEKLRLLVEVLDTSADYLLQLTDDPTPREPSMNGAGKEPSLVGISPSPTGTSPCCVHAADA
jgi:transcriptional regulator with XRE-family HTH domain